MSAGWKIFWLCTVVFTVAIGIAHVLVPGIVPIAFAEERQASWAVMTAFLLRAIELTAAWIAIMSLTIMLGVALRNWWRRRATI